MSKKQSKIPTLKLPSGEIIGIDAKGNVGRIINWSGDDVPHVMTIDVTAKELDAIVAAAIVEAKQPEFPKVPSQTEEGHDVYVRHADVRGNCDCTAKPGDVAIGCQFVPHKILLLGHRASLAARKKKARK